jgi:dolichyl-phosphate-mannose-protein mannosyltransferase
MPVSSSADLETLPCAPGTLKPGGVDSTKPGGSAVAETWLHLHLRAVALVVTAGGFAYRVFIASRSFLNPDEAIHYWLINQRSAWQAYKASLTNAHPPLFYLILYFWHLLGRSEFMLRMPSVIAGTALCWLAFRWLERVIGKASSLIGLVFFAFSPAIVALSAEVRAYSVMLVCEAGALYFLAAAFEEKSASRMWCFSIFLYLAIFSHYSVLFFVIAVGVYTLAQILDSRLPRKVVLAWALGQVGTLAEYAFLYVTHVSKVRKEIPIWGSEFFASYYQWGDENILAFTWRKTLNVFDFLFAQRYVSLLFLLLFLAGVAVILSKDILGRQKDTPMNRLGLLLLLPFALIWGASLAGVYPYAGTRHTVVLAPFAIAGVSFTLAAITRQRLWAGLLLTGLLVSVSNLTKDGIVPEVFRGDRSAAQMALAVNYMRKTIPRGDHLFVDLESLMPAAYYFCGPEEIVPFKTFEGRFYEFSCRGNLIVSLPNWKLLPAVFQSQFEDMARSYNLKPGDRVWVYQTGWGLNLDTALASYDSRFRCMEPKTLGANTTIIPFTVGPDFQPALLPGSCPNRQTESGFRHLTWRATRPRLWIPEEAR